MNASIELWRFMEKCYKEHGASSNGAQLIIRGQKLDKMVVKYGEEKVYDMLENHFDDYHFDGKDDRRLTYTHK